MVNKNNLGKLRNKFLNPSLSLSYDKPLHITRGEGQYLYDNTGKKYLDFINNIQYVDHCHPRITSTALSQMKKLNTNTRYIDRTILEYANALTQKLPTGFNVCFLLIQVANQMTLP